MISVDMDKKKNVDVAFGNNSSLDIDKIITFLCEIYEVPRPHWTMGEAMDSYFQAPDLLGFGFQEHVGGEDDYDWLEANIFHEFGHYLFYWATRLKYLPRDGSLEEYAWNRLERCLVDKHTMTHPLLSGEEAFAEAFASALFESFKELKPEYKEMFGLF